MATRLPASQHTREELTALIEGRTSMVRSRARAIGMGIAQDG